MSIFFNLFFNFDILLIALSKSKRFFLKLKSWSLSLLSMLLISFPFSITTLLFSIFTLPKIIFKHPPKKLLLAKIKQSSQIIMLIFPDIIEQPIVIILHNPQMLANLHKLIRVSLRCFQSHIFLLFFHRLLHKLVFFYCVDAPSLIVIFYEQPSDEISAGDADGGCYPCIFCFYFLVEDVLDVVFEGEVAVHHCE